MPEYTITGYTKAIPTAFWKRHYAGRAGRFIRFLPVLNQQTVSLKRLTKWFKHQRGIYLSRHYFYFSADSLNYTLRGIRCLKLTIAKIKTRMVWLQFQTYILRVWCVMEKWVTLAPLQGDAMGMVANNEKRLTITHCQSILENIINYQWIHLSVNNYESLKTQIYIIVLIRLIVLIFQLNQN